MNAKVALLALFVLTTSAAMATADVTQMPYVINPGGFYTYKPSGFGPGIPGGDPSAYQLDFGISGSFTYELDTAGPTARLLDLDLVLTGNEVIQASPPSFALVTADRVEEYLASHTFVEDFIGALLYLESATDSALKLTDTLSGGLLIAGGFDATPVDGTAALFNFSATAIPEPTGIALLIATALPLFNRSCRFCRQEGKNSPV